MTTTQTAAPLTFERFWHWLTEHPNCVVRAGTGESTLFDYDDFHWDFFEEDDGRAVAQLIRGKNLIGEIVIEKPDVLFVQGSIDVEDAQRGFWVFELIAGTKDDSYPVAYFVMSHGMEQTAGHQVLKH